MCYSFAFLDFLKETWGGYRIVVFTKSYLAALASHYECVDEVKILGDCKIKAVRALWKSDKYKEIFNDGLNGSPIFYCDNLNKEGFEILRIPSINYMDIQRYVYYGADKNERITIPVIPRISLQKFADMNFEKAVIINTYSVSMNIDKSIFDDIVAILKRNHMEVYTNVTGKGKALEETIPLTCTIEELYCLTKRVKFMISIRSGLLDFLQGNGAAYIVLYNDKTEWDKNFRKAYDMEGWQSESRIYQYNIGEKSEYEKLIDILCKASD